MSINNFEKLKKNRIRTYATYPRASVYTTYINCAGKYFTYRLSLPWALTCTLPINFVSFELCEYLPASSKIVVLNSKINRHPSLLAVPALLSVCHCSRSNLPPPEDYSENHNYQQQNPVTFPNQRLWQSFLFLQLAPSFPMMNC